ncbi:hypothetical protein [Pseudomonas sp. XK-1]|uniref:hypothetical protein n=1 Tax=Pseudomonas sp. XK-1 TaxID=3136019 RepID=UPI003119EE49
MDAKTTESINPELDFLNKLNRRKIAFILISIVFIPCSVALSYADKSQTIKSPLVDILMLISLLAPAIQTYLLTSMLFTKTKSFFLAAVMFFPTIILQIVILISVWAGINRATALRKSA